MLRTLLIIFAVGLIASVASFSIAASMGHYGFRSSDWEDGEWPSDKGEGAYEAAGETASRDIPWQGAEGLSFMVPGTVTYTQGETPKFTVTGPSNAIDKIVVEDGRVTFRDRNWHVLRGLKYDIVAPDVRSFTLNGSQTVTIEQYDQDTLEIEVNGSGDVIAKGKARNVDVEIRGSGSVDVSKIEGDAVRLEVMGSGDSRIAPLKLADIEIKGSGDVDLLSNPPEVLLDVKGSGDINRLGPPAQPAAAQPPAPQPPAAQPLAPQPPAPPAPATP